MSEVETAERGRGNLENTRSCSSVCYQHSQT